MDTFDIQGGGGQSQSMFVKNQLNSKHMKKQNMNKTHDNVYSNKEGDNNVYVQDDMFEDKPNTGFAN